MKVLLKKTFLFQRVCPNAGLFFPTLALDNMLSAAAGNIANRNNFESFCGDFLNPVSMSNAGGVVTSKFQIITWNNHYLE
jgi:hypothetical protein